MRNVRIRRPPFSSPGLVVFPPGVEPRSKASGQGAEERFHSLFEPDILIPTQYLETTRRKTYREPEKKLMLAVLEDAIWCFQKGLRADSKRRRILFREAEEWIFDKGLGALFSFENVCEGLDLEAGYVRKGLMRWKEEALNGRVSTKVYRISHLGERSAKPVTEPGDKSRRPLKAAGI